MLHLIGLPDLIGCDTPCVFKLAHYFNQKFIILQLGVDQLDIGLIFAHQISVCTESTLNVLSQFQDGS